MAKTKNNESSIEKSSFVILDGFEVYSEDLPTTMTIADAINACKKIGKDWTLPSLDQLSSIYKNRKKINGLQADFYFTNSTCTQIDGLVTTYWTINLKNGKTKELSEKVDCLIRPIRALKK